MAKRVFKVLKRWAMEHQCVCVFGSAHGGPQVLACSEPLHFEYKEGDELVMWDIELGISTRVYTDVCGFLYSEQELGAVKERGAIIEIKAPIRLALPRGRR